MHIIAWNKSEYLNARYKCWTIRMRNWLKSVLHIYQIFTQSTSLKRRLIIAFYAKFPWNYWRAWIFWCWLLILLHNNVCIHNGIEKRAENMFELCWLLHFVTSIIAGESSFSTDDNHDSTVVAFAIAPASALDLDRRRKIYGASGTSMHFPRMSEINCARVCRSWKGKEGFRRRELWGERVRRRRVRARLQKVASDEITIPDTSLSLAATDRWD